MDWRVVISAGVLGTLALVLAFLADRQSRRRREQAALPPDRVIPRLAEGAAPQYVPADQANTPPAGAHVALSDAEHDRLSAAATPDTTLSSGWADPRFVTDPAHDWAVLRGAAVVVVEAIGSVRELLPLLEKATSSAPPLVVIAGAIDPEALDTAAVNVVQRRVQAVVVRHPPADLRAVALRLGVDVVDRTALQSGWIPVACLAHVTDWVSAKESSWFAPPDHASPKQQ